MTITLMKSCPSLRPYRQQIVNVVLSLLEFAAIKKSNVEILPPVAKFVGPSASNADDTDPTKEDTLNLLIKIS